ncbi:MAG: hypothetical protein P1P63_08355 [Treponemataceae bacterium]
MAEQWERQRGESALQYAYFKTYLDMGVTRTIAKVQQKTNKSLTYLNTLSSRNNWVSRADAYDRYIDEMSRKENIEAIKKANKENIQLAQAIKYAVGKKAQALIKKIKEAGSTEELDEILSEINWNVLPTLANTAVEIERKAYGMNNEILNVSVESAGNADVDISIDIKKQALLEKLNAIKHEKEPPNEAAQEDPPNE